MANTKIGGLASLWAHANRNDPNSRHYLGSQRGTTSSPAEGVEPNLSSQLEYLAALHEQGHLTDNEYTVAKANLFAAQAGRRAGEPGRNQVTTAGQRRAEPSWGALLMGSNIRNQEGEKVGLHRALMSVGGAGAGLLARYVDRKEAQGAERTLHPVLNKFLHIAGDVPYKASHSAAQDQRSIMPTEEELKQSRHLRDVWAAEYNEEHAAYLATAPVREPKIEGSVARAYARPLVLREASESLESVAAPANEQTIEQEGYTGATLDDLFADALGPAQGLEPPLVGEQLEGSREPNLTMPSDEEVQTVIEQAKMLAEEHAMDPVDGRTIDLGIDEQAVEIVDDRAANAAIERAIAQGNLTEEQAVDTAGRWAENQNPERAYRGAGLSQQ